MLDEDYGSPTFGTDSRKKTNKLALGLVVLVLFVLAALGYAKFREGHRAPQKIEDQRK